jgi:Trk K+ transport system NAD-binding subunit
LYVSDKDMSKKTIFSDIDGTLVHQVLFENIDPFTSVALPGVVETMTKWFKEGHHIVLTTARPEELRHITIQEMDLLGIPFHQLVMGIGRAERILINNKSNKNPKEKRATAVEVEKNVGFNGYF